jgi:hypothetical protein
MKTCFACHEKAKESDLVNAYFDTIYRTFAFDLVPADGGNLALRGTLLTASGAAAAHRGYH